MSASAIADRPPARYRVSFAGILRSEWTKLRSVRSTRWSLLLTVLLLIAIGILVSAITESRYPDIHHGFQPLQVSLAGVMLAQFAASVLGVLTISAEYSTGMIRSSMCAVPKRLPVLWAKAIVYSATTFLISLPSILIAFFAGQAILAQKHIDISISHPGVLRALMGAALFLSAMGLFGLGLGAITRSTAAGISALVALVFVIPPILSLALPESWYEAIEGYLPLNAGGVMWSISPSPHMLAPWAGFGVLCAYGAISLALAALLMRRRDV